MLFSKRNIPNILSFSRVVATPLLMWLILQGQAATYYAAVLLLLAMALSDMLDGRIARQLNVVSPLGVYLDTISDKIFVVGVLLPMIERDLLSGWIALVIIGREFLVSGLRSFAAAEGQVISAGVWGKQKLVITVVALVWRLLAAGYEAGAGGAVAATAASDPYGFFVSLWPIPMAMAVLWTIISAVDYLWKARPILSETRTLPNQQPHQHQNKGTTPGK
jgi:CDP-diacylglycerol--glycerol-3-phosphate 3-phosphatidyltransferase